MFKWKRLSLVIIAVLVFIIIQARNENIEGPFRGILGNILNPVIYGINAVTNGVENIWHSYINLINVQKENELYKKQIDNLTLENLLLQEKVSQAERLKTLSSFYKTYEFTKVAANVIGRSDGYIRSIIIDKGSADGITKNDPVVGFQGLVGRVTNTFLNTSEVDVLLNISSNVSVMNSRTRVTGILRGDGKGALYVDYYDKLDSVKEGDVFITSGLGRLYPKGIRVGKVAKIEKNKEGLFQKIFLDQSEDFFKLEYVFIVKDFK